MHLAACYCLFKRLCAHIIMFMHEITWNRASEQPHSRISVRAVVFDFGNVLCLEQSSDDMADLARLCGIPTEPFCELYWALRPSYDRGDVDGTAYWNSVVRKHGRTLSSELIAKLIGLDSASIARPNQGAVRWVQLLQAARVPLALLSNMPTELSRYVQKNCQWLAAFDHLIFSCDHGSIKPEPTIFSKCLEALRLDPAEVLYLDDRRENIEAASRFGIHSVLFDTVDRATERVRGRFHILVPPCGR
jgi:putative hydrolase of the HAD superfamily